MVPGVVLQLAQLMMLLATALAERDPYYDATSRDVDPMFHVTAREVANWTPCTEVSAWELGNLVESDIMDSPQELRTLTSNSSRKWQNQTLPFFIEQNDFNAEQVRDIRNVIGELNKMSCVNIRDARRDDKDLVRIKGKAQGCFSYVGRKGGEQHINLQAPACVERGNIFHELLHTLGFLHEHTNPKRDDYITIMWGNIKKGKDVDFKKVTQSESYGMRYDYDSIMHGSRKYHSKNGRNTIETHDPLAIIGQRMSPSFFDISKLKLHYDCVPRS